jgi:hypothetical protein
VVPAGPFLGDVSVETVAVNGDGNTSAWTGVGGGTNDWERIDDALGTDADGDTTYIESSTAGQQSLFTFADLPADYDSQGRDIHCVAVNCIARQVEPGGASFYVVQRRSATDEYNPYRCAVADGYLLSQTLLHTDATGIAWTPANVDASEFGAEVEAE